MILQRLRTCILTTHMLAIAGRTSPAAFLFLEGAAVHWEWLHLLEMRGQLICEVASQSKKQLTPKANGVHGI